MQTYTVRDTSFLTLSDTQSFHLIPLPSPSLPPSLPPFPLPPPLSLPPSPMPLSPYLSMQEFLSGGSTDSCTPQNLGLLLIYHLQVTFNPLYVGASKCAYKGLICITYVMLSLSSPVYQVEMICLALLLYLYRKFGPCQLSCLGG